MASSEFSVLVPLDRLSRHGYRYTEKKRTNTNITKIVNQILNWQALVQIQILIILFKSNTYKGVKTGTKVILPRFNTNWMSMIVN